MMVSIVNRTLIGEDDVGFASRVRHSSGWLGRPTTTRAEEPQRNSVDESNSPTSPH